MILDLLVLLVADPDAADKLRIQADKHQVEPVRCCTGLASDRNLYAAGVDLCCGTGTVLNNILKKLIHNIRGFLVDYLFIVIIRIIEDRTVRVLDAADDMRIIEVTAVAVYHIRIDKILDGNAVAECADGERCVVNVIAFVQVEAECLGCEIKHLLSAVGLDQQSRNGVVGALQRIVDVDCVAGVADDIIDVSIVRRPRFFLAGSLILLGQRRDVHNVGTPCDIIMIKCIAVAGNRLDCGTRLLRFGRSKACTERALLFADAAAGAEHSALVVDRGEAGLKRQVLFIGIFAVAVEVTVECGCGGVGHAHEQIIH